MLRHFRRFLTRHDPMHHWRSHLKSTGSAVLGLAAIGGLAAWTGLPLLMAPLGPTALALSAHPDSPSAQPINIFAGYFIAAVVASGAQVLLPHAAWAAAITVGVVMLVMLLLRVNHPPAAAVPLAVFASPIAPQTLFEALFAGCVCLVAVAMVMHRIPPRARYPRLLEPSGE
jgi:CBS-domain-containing membrane protein